MTYEVVMPYHLHMPSYFLGTFTEYPFAKEGEVVWQCRNCGFIYTGKEAPQVCPACLHPQAYFEVKKENY